MYEIVYSAKSEESLDIFINSYKSTFTDLFYDSGIHNVDEIISRYEQIGDRFYESIRAIIRKKLTQQEVLGRQIDESKNISIKFYERSFLIIIDYTEDKETKTRYIENILFTRK